MNTSDLWNVKAKLSYHVYQENVENFIYANRKYSEWTLLTPEHGSFEFEFCGISGTAFKGDLVICPPDTDFNRKVLSTLSFHFMTFHFTNHSGKILTQSGGLPIGMLSINNLKRLDSTFSILKSTPNDSSFEVIQWKNHLLNDLWNLYLAESSVRLKPEIYETNDEMIRTAVQYINKNAFLNCSIKSVSELVCLSAVQFTRKFKNVLGITPSEYLTSLRLKMARSLLIETNMSLQQIAAACGYDNEYYFSRIFTKKEHVNPSVYRKINRV